VQSINGKNIAQKGIIVNLYTPKTIPLHCEKNKEVVG